MTIKRRAHQAETRSAVWFRRGPQICPEGTEKEMFLIATLEPKDLVTPLICTRSAEDTAA
jgi:hypothetical protein